MPRAPLTRHGAIAVLFVLLAHGSLQAQALHPTDQRIRWVQQSGFAVVQGGDGVVGPVVEQFHEHYSSPDLLFGAYDVTDKVVMDVESPDGSAAVHLRGVTSHFSLVTPTSITFETSVSRSAWTTGTPGPLTVGSVGWSDLGSHFYTFFDLDAPALATLSIDVNVPNSHFVVSLATVDALGGTSLWYETVGPTSSDPSFAHELTKPLRPGLYHLYAEFGDILMLGAPAYSNQAGFSMVLAPIPELGTWALTLAALGCLSLRIRCARRSAAA